MEATILNRNFETIGIIDTYRTFIWTDRYDEYGDFELHLSIKNRFPEILKKDHYIWTSGSDHMMIIETIGIEDDVEEGARFVVKGRSLESILTRRIVWNKKIFLAEDENTPKPNLQNGIKTLLDENVIDAVEARKIPNFIFEESTDEAVTSIDFEGEFLGEELYEVVSKLCKENEIGFKLTLNSNNQFVFKLYKGADRSYGEDDKPQTKNPYVVFSPQFENILSTSFIDSYIGYKNITLVDGETKTDKDGNVTSRLVKVVGNEFTGLDRREAYTDATSLSMEDENGGTLEAERYKALLNQKGIDTLIENVYINAFEGEVDPNVNFKYGKDYFVGDIVQIEDQYGHATRACITEYIMSCDEGGFSAYPTFQNMQKGVYEA